MSKRRQTVLICGLGALAGAVAFCVLQQREPRYEGKPLSIWLEDFDRWHGDINAPVVRAVCAMGDEAAPILARVILAKESVLKRNVLAKLELYLKLNLTTDTERWLRANRALSVMGEHASAAAPIFLKALTKDDEIVREHALKGFALLGPQFEQYLPAIIKLEHDPALSVRSNLIIALGRIGRRQDLCKPVLLRAVEDSDSWVRHLAVVALSEFGSEAETTKAVTRTNQSVGNSVADSRQKNAPDE